jgi:hypothetical protein
MDELLIKYDSAQNLSDRAREDESPASLPSLRIDTPIFGDAENIYPSM